jgi:hypothetical protein
MELVIDEATPPALERHAQRQSEALDLICEWLHANNTG